MIKVVSFDIGNTLYRFESKIDKIVKNFSLDYDLVYKNYKKYFQKSSCSFEKKVKIFCEKSNLEISIETLEFFENIFNNKKTGELININTFKVFEEIKAKKIKIILFSNAIKDNTDRIDKKLLSLIDKVYFSCNIGYSKDDEESYEFIMKELNVMPHEIVHIGDSYKQDYLIPKSLGWNALLFKGKNEDSINDIKEVLNYIK